jgi:hypothetical protein
MDLMGLCNICGKPGVMNTCNICGKQVCNNCFDLTKGVCSICKRGKL